MSCAGKIMCSLNSSQVTSRGGYIWTPVKTSLTNRYCTRQVFSLDLVSSQALAIHRHIGHIKAVGSCAQMCAGREVKPLTLCTSLLPHILSKS